MKLPSSIARLVKLSVVCVSAAALIQTGAASPFMGSKNVHKLIHLDAGTAEPKAQGIAKISAKMKIKKPKQDFQVVGANLKISDTYDLFVDGVKVASQAARAEQGDEDMDTAEVTQQSGGAVEFLFSSKAHTEDSGTGGPLPLPASLDPVTNIKKVEIKNAAGDVVLSGEFS
jgi:hypothetical protein